jgi:5-methylcytosine-specific restriction endonuclease McrA
MAVGSAVLLCAAAGTGPVLRWVLVPLAACGVLVLPMLTRAGRQVIPLAWRPRRRRMLRRQAGLEKRGSVPAWIRRATYAADRYRCLSCRWRQRDGADLQWDHVIPWGFGGLTSLGNGGTLCSRCNQVKSNYWRSDTGKVYYRGFELATDQGEAGKITRREMRARANPLRWARMGLACWAMR